MNRARLHNVSISLENMKILKISRSNQKRETPIMLIITCVFEEKNYVGAPKQKRETPIMLIITVVFEGF